jgi:steroid delta-isomerase-like uncharacterized protein
MSLLEQLVRRHVEAENAHRMEEVLATLHPDCVFEDVAQGRTWRGHAGAAEYYGTWWRAFDLFVKGDRRHWTVDGALVGEARFQGRHVGAFLGIPASGRSIDLRIAAVLEFRDGLMLGERFYYDVATLRRQLEGAAPAAEAR